MQYRITLKNHNGGTFAEVMDVDEQFNVMKRIAECMDLIEAGFYKGVEITREGD